MLSRGRWKRYLAMTRRLRARDLHGYAHGSKGGAVRTILAALATLPVSIARAYRRRCYCIRVSLMLLLFSATVAEAPLLGAPPTKDRDENLQKLTAKEL